MNGFNKNNVLLFSLLMGVLFSNSLDAMKVYNQPLKEIVTSIEKPFSITFLEGDDTVLLKMEKENFDAKSGNSRDAIEGLDHVFKVVNSGVGFSCNSDVFSMLTNILDCSSMHFVGKERIDFQTTTSLELRSCLIESPLVSIIGSKMHFNDCFLINPKILNIIADCPESDYKIIQIIFRDHFEKPTIITGEIDLKDKQTTKNLILTNVQKIIVEFNPHVWNK